MSKSQSKGKANKGEEIIEETATNESLKVSDVEEQAPNETVSKSVAKASKKVTDEILDIVNDNLISDLAEKFGGTEDELHELVAKSLNTSTTEAQEEGFVASYSRSGALGDTATKCRKVVEGCIREVTGNSKGEVMTSDGFRTLKIYYDTSARKSNYNNLDSLGFQLSYNVEPEEGETVEEPEEQSK